MKPVVLVNILTVKPGKMDEFLRQHETFSTEFGETCSGLLGGRMYRSRDGNTAMLVSEFESREASEEIRNLPLVRENIKKLQPLVDESKPTVFEIAFAYGPPARP